MEEKLKISDYFVRCLNLEEHPEDESNLKDIEQFLNHITIREYIPLKEKEILMMNILTTLNIDYDAPGAAVMLEMGKVITALLAYCVNIENDISLSNALYHCTDLVYQFGLYDLVMERAGKDYHRLMHMIDNTVNFSNIYRFTQTAALFDGEALEDWNKAIRELDATLSTDIVKELSKQAMNHDEGLTEIGQILQESAMDQVNKEYKDEEAKFARSELFKATTAKIRELEREEKADTSKLDIENEKEDNNAIS